MKKQGTSSHFRPYEKTAGRRKNNASLAAEFSVQNNANCNLAASMACQNGSINTIYNIKGFRDLSYNLSTEVTNMSSPRRINTNKELNNIKFKLEQLNHLRRLPKLCSNSKKTIFQPLHQQQASIIDCKRDSFSLGNQNSLVALKAISQKSQNAHDTSIASPYIIQGPRQHNSEQPYSFYSQASHNQSA